MQADPATTVSRARPTSFLDDTSGTQGKRASSYGELAVEQVGSWRQKLADEGSYFSVVNPAIGTGVVNALVTAFSDTAAMFAIKNGAAVGQGQAPVKIFPDFIRMVETATAPAGTLRMEWLCKVGTKDRTPSANLLQQTPQNANGGNIGSVAQFYSFAAGSLTVPNAEAAARVYRGTILTGVCVLGDEYELQIGAPDRSARAGGLTAARATSPASIVGHMGPVVVNPGEWAVFYMWWITAATNTPSFEYEVAWWER